MDPDEIVPEGIERDHVSVVFEFFAERVGQSGEPAHRHPHGEVRPLHVGRADVFGVRVAGDLVLARSRRSLTGCSAARLREKRGGSP